MSDTVPPKLHPLHSVEFLTHLMQVSGRYPDRSRNTGRTFIIALKTIVQALENPHLIIVGRDHHESTPAQQHLKGLIVRLIRSMGLDHMYVNNSVTSHGVQVSFGNPLDDSAVPAYGVRPVVPSSWQKVQV